MTAVFGGVFSGCDWGEGIEKPTDRMQTPSIENRRSLRLNSRPGSALKPKLNGFLSEQWLCPMIPLRGATRWNNVSQANQGRWPRQPWAEKRRLFHSCDSVNNEGERATVTIVDGMR